MQHLILSVIGIHPDLMVEMEFLGRGFALRCAEMMELFLLCINGGLRVDCVMVVQLREGIRFVNKHISGGVAAKVTRLPREVVNRLMGGAPSTPTTPSFATASSRTREWKQEDEGNPYPTLVWIL